MTMSDSPNQFILPDLFALCPLKEATNPHYKEAGAESKAWINSFNIFTDRKRAFFVQGSNELLVSYTYPYAGYNQFRTCCDFVNLLFVVDEVSDDQDSENARQTCQVFLKAMKYPDWNDQSTLAKITKEFRSNFICGAGPGCLRRFLMHCESYTNAVSTEAGLREHGQVLDLASFIPLRRENSAVLLCFDLMEYALGIDLPEDVFRDPIFSRLYWAAADMICWSNDVYSYSREQATGQSGNNIVTVLMREKNFDLQAASDYVGVYFGQLMERFVKDRARLPSWGASVDADVSRYVDALGYWCIGNLVWCFDSQRYFGVEHLDVKRTRIVTLNPRRHSE